MKASILSVDAVAADAELLEKSLKDIGFKYDFFRVSTLHEGIAFIEKHSVDLAFLDINLPDVNGFKAITTFLELAPHVPVVVVTSTNNEIIINQSIKAGVQDFLLKGQFDAKLLCRVARFSLHRFKVQSKFEVTAKELEAFKKRFLEAQKMASFGTWEMDVVSNEMVWSDEVYRIFSLEFGKFVPTLSEYLKFVPSDDRSAVESFFEEAGKDGILHSLEHRIAIDSLTMRYVLVQAMVKVEEATHKVMLVGSIQDVTERKTSERLLLEKAISSQTASMQEEVLADLGFQIRTPLSSIVNLMFLLGNTETSKQQALFINDLKTSVNDLSISVNNLLNFSLMVTDTVKVQEEDITLLEFLKGAVNVVKIKSDTAKMFIQFMPSDRMPERVSADPRKLTQVIYNLVEHALRQGEEKETIIVKASCGPLYEGQMDLILQIVNSNKRLSAIELQEVNEAESIIRHAFGNNKEQVPQKRLMGLAISTKLIKSLNGSVTFQNLAPVGSEILVKIPVKPSKKKQFASGEAPIAPLKILMVEDHFLNQLATKKVLQTWSKFVTVDIAENGQLGYEAVRDGDYDLVLMDIQMPVMNGLDAAKRIREFSQIPIIALTANSNKQEEEKCLEIGMNDYLSKPYKPHELYERILAVMSMVAV